MSTLASRSCGRPTARLDASDVAILAADVPQWTIAGDARRISRRFSFSGFEPAWAFVTRLATLAREQDHHPDIAFGWGYAEVSLTTHSVGGLSDNDFICAARIDRLVPA